jgi:hypothetical protein
VGKSPESRLDLRHLVSRRSSCRRTDILNEPLIERRHFAPAKRLRRLAYLVGIGVRLAVLATMMA